MARMLGRSKSMRMLRGFNKESHQRDGGATTPQPALNHAGMDRLEPFTHAATTDFRVETPDPRHRPQTAGGPADRNKQFHKKVAPAALDSEHQMSTFTTPSSTTVLYAAEVSEDGVIGIALGSPTMTSPWSNTPHSTDFVTQSHGTVTHISSNHSAVAHSAEPNHGASKPKLSRWKSIFGRKNTTPPEPKRTIFYHVQPAEPPARADSHHEEESLYSRSVSRAESHELTPPPAFKSEIRGSRKLPELPAPPRVERPRARTETDALPRGPRTTLKRADTNPHPPRKDSLKPAAGVPEVVVSTGSLNSSSRTMVEKPFLDVDIPRIEMERYSVMFGNLLQPNRSSSLLVRRQGNPEKLKTLTEVTPKAEESNAGNGMLKPQRRATSPSMPKSPVSLSLFPQPEKPRDSRVLASRVSVVNRPRQLQRSKTAPTAAHSPRRPDFPARIDQETKEPRANLKPAQDEDEGSKTQLLTPTPSTRHSFESTGEDITFVVARAPSPWEGRVNEPEWEIVSKAPVHSMSQNRKTKPKSGASPKSADVPTQQVDNLATVGVARTVSVSRAAGLARREMLKPMVVKAPDLAEKLVEKKPLTPTLIELQNRKSQRVQIVEA